MTLADRIVALRDGRIEQVGSPDELYARPANRFVAGFIGSPTMNFLDARLEADGDGLVVVPTGGPPPAGAGRPRRALPPRTPAGRSSSASGPRTSPTPGPRSAATGAGVVPLDLSVEIAEPLGSDTLIFSRLGASEIVGRLSATAAPAVGSTIRLNAHLNHMHLFDPDTGAAL